jgi:glycosyltransferase involved in cell wall biosynthesis
MVKVSIGMPAFNRANVLKSSIQQVLDQTFKDFELIIYNDGSTDNTVEIIKGFNDPRIQLIDRENLGPPHPLNGILKESRGEYIIILHDHDFFHPQLLEKSIDALDRNPKAGFVLQGSAWIDEDGISNYREMLHDLPEYNNGFAQGIKMLTNPKNFNSIFHACCMVRRSYHEKAGLYYDERFGLYADTDLWYRLLRISDFIYIKEVLFKFRTRETNGHFLSNREFEILNWVFGVACLNIERFYDNEKSINFARKISFKKWIKNVRLAIIQSACNKNKLLYSKGLNILKTSSDSRLELLLVKRFYKSGFIVDFSMNFLYVINIIRVNFLKK